MWRGVVEMYIRKLACLDWFFLPNILLLFSVLYLQVSDVMFYCEILSMLLIQLQYSII
jgi:hypothetical protein